MFQAATRSPSCRVLSVPLAKARQWPNSYPHGRGHVSDLAPQQLRRNTASFQQQCVLNRVGKPQGRARTFTSMAKQNSWWTGQDPSRSSSPDDTLFESQPMAVPAETSSEAEQLPTRRIHIMGLGSIGMLIAHSLKCLPNPPPISLLMHRSEMYSTFKANNNVIRLLNPATQVNDEQRGYDVDLLRVDIETRLPHWEHFPCTPDTSEASPVPDSERVESGEVYIYNLIVSVKGPATLVALSSIKHRINSSTTICLMQNGMGQIDELNIKVFNDPATRPTYMLGIVSHGVYTQGAFSVVHAGFGSTALGIWRDVDKFPLPPKSSTLDVEELPEQDRRRMYPSEDDLYANLSSRYLLRTLTRSPVLTCASFPYLDLMQLQLEKLAMNAVLNPVTALLDIPNGSLLDSRNLTKIQRLLLAEISLVIRGLPELDGIPGVNLRFSANRLERLLVSIAQKTARNSSSMREDIRSHRRTETDFINGYVVRRGEEQGIKCVLNFMLAQLVKAKSNLTRADDDTEE